ncbi:MAG: ferrous iron transport protein B [Desulfitobacteriaceae bacterium]|nr:ferrous iron transport protein B [Desulfitobacteriaceae bacterium]MDD4751928.1 ferrous iron transport protein B [Desulfitobacteriaceae bacterium]
MQRRELTIALAGNPNCGKTTLFNKLTGSRYHVGNYPGVTVEQKIGEVEFQEYRLKLIDLPGIYGLTAYSPDEVVARNVLLKEKIDVVINVVDATSLERGLNLTVQLKELGIPMVLALNMVDAAREIGLTVDCTKLSQCLHFPAVPVVGTKGDGFPGLLQAVIRAAEGNSEFNHIFYGAEIEKAINTVTLMISENLDVQYDWRIKESFLLRWLAVKLLESDRAVKAEINTLIQDGKLEEAVQKGFREVFRLLGKDPEAVIINQRYSAARKIFKGVVSENKWKRITVTEKIDKIILNKYFGLPIFFVIMWILFRLIFSLGGPFTNAIEWGFSSLSTLLITFLPEGLFRSILVDGIIGGVGGVITFLPNILLLFLGIALLESTGYMARAAFIMDRMMTKAGLHGKSFIPMLLGFGCSIPALMATRILENPRDRIVTMLVVPLMSCGARLPVYTLLAAAFFETDIAGSVVFSIYVAGMILAVIMAKVLRSSVVKGPSEPFIMELPPYRLPVMKSVLIQMINRAKMYLKKAGTVILLASIIIWFFFSFSFSGNKGLIQYYPAAPEKSIAGDIGHALEPVLTPLGLDWKSGVVLLSGLAAKEVVVSTMGTLYSIQDNTDLSSAQDGSTNGLTQRVREQSGLTPLTSYVFMLFVLIYIPCISTVAVFHQETGTWRWPLFLVGYTFALAWIVCFVVYRGGLFLFYS